MPANPQSFILISQESGAVSTETYRHIVNMARGRKATHNASSFLAVSQVEGMGHFVDSNYGSSFKKLLW